jgi:hypothetical protein
MMRKRVNIGCFGIRAKSSEHMCVATGEQRLDYRGASPLGGTAGQDCSRALEAQAILPEFRGCSRALETRAILIEFRESRSFDLVQSSMLD